MSLNEILQETLEKTQSPGIGAVIVSTDETIAEAVLGKRRADQPDLLQMDDKFHIGSNAKAMTATLISLLDEQGVLPLDASPATYFSVLDAYQGVTLDQVLRHMAGLHPYEEDEQFETLPDFPDEPRANRAEFAEYVLNEVPLHEPGTEFSYSNVGYTVAAAMMEAATNKSWETLMHEMLFVPLKIDGGFGWAAKDDPQQPWGHTLENGIVTPHDPNGDYQLEIGIAPAGDVHLSLPDYGRFLQMNLRALHGKETILSASALRRLHVKVGRSGLGWGVQELAGQTFSVHSGSADTFYILAAVGHDVDVAFALVMNYASEDAAPKLVEGFKAILASQVKPL